MKRSRIIGLSLLALLALGAFAASSANAVEGFLPLTTKTFKVLNKSAEATLETASAEGVPVKCRELKGEGTFETNFHGKLTFDLEHCTALGFPINSLGDKEGLILFFVLFLGCLINSASLTFGLFVELTSPLHLVIPALAGFLLTFEGSWIGEIATKEGTLFVLNFKGQKGTQEVAKECVDEKGGAKKGTLKTSDPKSEGASENLEALLQTTETQKLMDT
jgi:hypothetical protein